MLRYITEKNELQAYLLNSHKLSYPQLLLHSIKTNVYQKFCDLEKYMVFLRRWEIRDKKGWPFFILRFCGISYVMREWVT